MEDLVYLGSHTIQIKEYRDKNGKISQQFLLTTEQKRALFEVIRKTDLLDEIKMLKKEKKEGE